VNLPAVPDAFVTECGGTLDGNVRFSLTNGGAALPYAIESEAAKIAHINMNVVDAAQTIYARAEATASDKAGVPSSDAVAYWPMGDASSPSVNWANAGTLDGTGVGSPTWGDPGQIDGAVTLNGTTQYLSCGNYLFPNALTLGFWANWNLATSQVGFPIASGAANVTYTYGIFIYKVNATHVRIDLYFFTNASHYRDWTWLYTDAALPQNTFCRILISQASALAVPVLYLNGVLQGAPAETAFGTPTRSTQALSIGARGAYAAQRFPGTLDHVGIWNAVLSADRKKLDYACGTGSIFGAWETVATPPTVSATWTPTVPVLKETVLLSAVSTTWTPVVPTLQESALPSPVSATWTPVVPTSGRVVLPSAVSTTWTPVVPTLQEAATLSPVTASWTPAVPVLKETVLPSAVSATWTVVDPIIRTVFHAPVSVSWTSTSPTLVETLTPTAVSTTWSAATATLVKLIEASPVTLTWAVTVLPGQPVMPTGAIYTEVTPDGTTYTKVDPDTTVWTEVTP